MAITKIADVIIPELFIPYVRDRTAELSAFVRSGIVSGDERIKTLANSGGVTVNMPFWNPIGGEAQVLSDTNPLTTEKLTAQQDVAIVNYRGNGWTANDLAGALAGSDPLQSVVEQTAVWRALELQKRLLAMLTGVFAAATMSGHVYTTTDALGAEVILRAKNLLGDAAEQLTGIAVNSADYTELQIQNLVSNIPHASADVGFGTYLSKYSLIVDDMIPAGTCYLFTKGAFGFGDGSPAGVRADWEPVEIERNAAAGNTSLFYRWADVLHPRGVAWNGPTTFSGGAASPTNTQFAAGGNWKRVYQPKNVGLIKLLHSQPSGG